MINFWIIKIKTINLYATDLPACAITVAPQKDIWPHGSES